MFRDVKGAWQTDLIRRSMIEHRIKAGDIVVENYWLHSPRTRWLALSYDTSTVDHFLN